ncbi:MAG TPA: TA system VapC family ribonuclease toxin [Candidatus Saccharimonadales bacterium]|nr:TA system VapC family ribonuclease toxin [Candidatus Saccharimonadales bacterium]
MRRSTTSFLFPDLNVWLALSYQAHAHHLIAQSWFVALPETARLCFCRLTQMGLLRMLTTQAIMRDEVMTQGQAWQVYDTWLADERVFFAEEPPTLEPAFRALTRSGRAANKDWGDSYLIAFARSAGFELVTFDKAMQGKADGILLL